MYNVPPNLTHKIQPLQINVNWVVKVSLKVAFKRGTQIRSQNRCMKDKGFMR